MTQIKRIIREYFNRTHSPIVHESFIRWFRNERSAQEKEDALRDIWDELTIAPDQTTEASFVKLQQRIVPYSGFNPRPSIVKILYGKWLRIAAVLLIPILSLAAAYLYVKNTIPTSHPTEWVECFVPNGEISEITLSDSSVVQINSGSILIYPKAFAGETRDLYLNGEASFTIVRNEHQPFIVKTADMDIEVLGTVFNVCSYNNDTRVSTTLESGKIHVRLKNDKAQSFILEPNDRLSIDRTTGVTHIDKVNVENIVAWKKGYLLVEGLTIDDISKMLERKHHVVIHINSDKYSGQLITAKFKNNENLTESLSVLQQLIPGMKYKIEGNIIYIY